MKASEHAVRTSEHPEGATVLCRCKKCGGVAFYLSQRMEVGEFFKASNVILVDGSKPDVHSIADCGTCGRRFSLHLSIGQEDIS